MTPPCARCGNPLQLRVNLSAEELSALDNDLRFESGQFVVTPERAEKVRTIVDLVDKDLEDYDSELARLREHIMAVQAEKRRLEIHRAKLCALSSPMRKLPNETLLRIFQHACKENILQRYPWRWIELPPTYIKKSRAITYLSSMVISSVCFRWRALALSSPALWANLTLETHTMEKTSDSETEGETFESDGLTNTVIRYLERSSDWPLTLTLTMFDGHGILSKEVPSLTHLVQNASRWKTFKLMGTYLLLSADMPSKMHFPLLEELVLSHSDSHHWYSEDRAMELDYFVHSPRLRALFTGIKGPASEVLYNQLEHLDLRGQPLTKLIEALCSCPNLKSLELADGLDASNSRLEQGVLGTWFNITSITMRSGSSRAVFSCFNFPSLNNLVVSGTYDTRWTADDFIPFVSGSSCVITSFTLQKVELLDVDLIAALRVMPTLLHLEVYACGYRHNPITSHLISSLTHHPSTSVTLVPKLHSLHLKDRPADEFDDAGFVRMVASRWFKPGSDLSAEMLAMGRSSIRSVLLEFYWSPRNRAWCRYV
ncbi:hypothetical protein BDP27DRAFT_627295 [Rhodocollybia butyracea]|uniref:F-box domain-containing protein n=1 Tax=Rhodocollybia butyracea TaxID=206335 RepID=A0A9P5TWB4_9AGAR|nr:hypothetical protein BDP27DRAFT_627295 [Rhodocollybia butyracea]